MNLPSGRYKFSASVETTFGGDTCLIKVSDTQGAFLTSAQMPKSIAKESHEVILNCQDSIRYITLYPQNVTSSSQSYEATWSNIKLIRLGEWQAPPTPF